MKLIIAGGRDFPTNVAKKLVEYVVKASNWEREISLVLEGGALGIDRGAYLWAEGLGLPTKRIEARWNDWDGLPADRILLRRNSRGELYNAKAGPNRNEEMGEEGDRLIAIPGQNSRGTYHMIRVMKDLGKPTIVYDYTNGKLIQYRRRINGE